MQPEKLLTSDAKLAPGSLQKTYLTPVIPYFDGLPSEGAELQFLDHKQFSQKFGCQYTESILIDPALKSSLQWNPRSIEREGVISGISQADLKAGIEKLKIGSVYNLAIVKMDPKVGYGVFALKFIPRHTVVCLYAGEVKLGRQVFNEVSYDYIFHTGNFRIDAIQKRGMAGFMQHLPGNTQAFGEKHSLFASTNVMVEFVVIDNVPMIALVALRDIYPDEQVGFSYGDYWNRRKSPCVFYHSGKIADTKDYTPIQLMQSHAYYAIDFKTYKPPTNIVEKYKKKQSEKIDRPYFFPKNPTRTITVKIIDKNQVISSYTFRDQLQFLTLKFLIGSPQIKKLETSPLVFEINYKWLNDLDRFNPNSIGELANLFGTTEEIFRRDNKLPKAAAPCAESSSPLFSKTCT